MRQGGRRCSTPSPFHPPSDALLAATRVIVVNEREAWDLASALGLAGGFISSQAIVDLGAALFARGPELLVVTLGAQGAVAYGRDASEPVLQRAFPVAAVDTLGAGDAFVATLAVGLAQARPLAETLRRAAAAGAIVATRAGVCDSLPTAAEIDGLLAL